MTRTGVLAAAAAAAGATAACLVQPAQASIYPVHQLLPYHSAEAFIKDTPMFSLKDSPRWIGGLSEPYITIAGTVESPAEHPDEDFDVGEPVIRIIHAWAEQPPQIRNVPDSDNFITCTNQPSSSDFDGFEILTVFGKGSNKIDFDLEFAVNTTGWHITIVTNCMGTAVDFNAEFEYKNPYGYLNGWAFGIMPMNGFLCLAYGMLAVVYIFKTLRNREHVLRLQYAIIGVIIMGFIERLTWFLTYLEMNTSGGRACCPVRGDLTFSLTLAVFKRSSSALLLLAVCLGFGVVKPTLDRSTNIKIIALGLFYTFSSLNLEIEKIEDISLHGRQTDPLYMSSLIVSICDVVILFWIYFAISEVLRELREAQQIVKLGMYQTLARSLTVWVAIWFLFTLMEVLVFNENVNVHWWYWFLLVSFWDLFFLGILLQICYVWAPSELTAQYAFSHQLPTSEDLDEFDAVGSQMNMPDSASDFVIGEEDDEDDDDDELSLDGVEMAVDKGKKKGGSGDKVALS